MSNIPTEKEPAHDYANIEVPRGPRDADEDGTYDKPYPEFTYVERRAWLYRRLRDAGHPANLEMNQRKLADMFGKSQPTICRDLQKLREYQRTKAGDSAIETMEWVSEKTVRELASEGEWREAFKTQKEYMEWLFDMGVYEKEPDQLEVDGEGVAIFTTTEQEEEALQDKDDGV